MAVGSKKAWERKTVYLTAARKQKERRKYQS
jgi:hypothetical protein